MSLPEIKQCPNKMSELIWYFKDPGKIIFSLNTEKQLPLFSQGSPNFLTKRDIFPENWREGLTLL